MAYCGKGVKRACGFNHAGVRVRVCEKHRKLKSRADGKKLKTAKPLRDYTNQKKYNEKYKTLAWIREKAARGSKAAKALLAKKLKAKSKPEKRKADRRAKKPQGRRAADRRKTERRNPEADRRAEAVAQSKALKAARDKKYRESKKAKAQNAAAGAVQVPSTAA